MTLCRKSNRIIRVKREIGLKNTRTLRAAGALAILMVIVSVVGCTSTGVQAAGWSGVAVTGGSLFFGSGKGELVGLSVASGTQLWNPIALASASSGGGFGCAAPSTLVAVYGTPATDGTTVYVAGYNGAVYKIVPSSVTSNTTYLDESRPKPVVGGPIVAQGRVYVASDDGKLYALDATTLAKVWEFKTGDKLWSTPALDGGTLFIGSFDKKVYAVDAENGKEKWSFATQGAIVATPLISGGTVYVASFDRHIYALDEASGALKWQFPAEGDAASKPERWFWASPVMVGGTIYVPCLDGKVYLLKASDGSLLSALDLGASISSSPVVVNSKVILATEDGKLYSLDEASTQGLLPILNLRTQANSDKLIVRAPLAASGDIVYIHTLGPESIYAFNLGTRQLVWQPYTVN